jgi:hypothetical protein
VRAGETAVARIEQAAIESESKLKPRKVTIDEAYGFAVALGVPLDVLLPYEGTLDYSEPVTTKQFEKSVNDLRRLLEARFEMLEEDVLELHSLLRKSEVKQ